MVRNAVCEPENAAAPQPTEEQFGSMTKDAEAPFSSGGRLPDGCVLGKNNCPWSILDKSFASQEA